MNRLKRAGKGFSFLLDGFKLLADKPGLRKWVILPFLIDFLLFLIGIYGAILIIPSWITGVLNWFFPDPSGFLFSAVHFILLILFWLVFIIVWTVGVCLLAGIVASPFNAVLAEKTLLTLGLIESRPFNLKSWAATTLSLFFTAIFKSILFIFLGILIFFFSLFPVLNIFSSYLALIIVACDSLDYSLEILEMNLRQRLQYYRELFPELSGMAGALALTLLIPGLTLLILPLAVIGGAQVIGLQPPSWRKKLGSRYYSSKNS